MKTKLMTAIILTAAMGLTYPNANGQGIPNYSFENWSLGANAPPDGWEDQGSNHAGFFPASQTTDKYHGSYAVKLESKITSTDTTPGRISTKRPAGQGGFGPSFPVNVRYNNLKGFYKYTSLNGDSAEIIVYITKTGYVNTGGWGNLLGWGQKRLPASTTYAPFSVGYLDSLPNIFYDSPTVVPDSAYIDLAAYISIGLIPGDDPQPKGNSVLYVDGLNFDTYLNGIDEGIGITANFKLYPNANNGAFDVTFELLKPDFATMKIYDLNGRLVSDLFEGNLDSGEHQCHYNVSGLPGGDYMFVIATVEGYKAHKLSVQK